MSWPEVFQRGTEIGNGLFPFPLLHMDFTSPTYATMQSGRILKAAP